MELSQKQIEIILPLLPQPKRRSDGKGRPPRDALEVLMGVLWILRTGAPWKDMPDRYPPYQTCHRRYSQWVKQGAIDNIIKALAIVLNRRGEIDLNEAFIDGSFTAAKKGGLEVGKTKRGKGTKIMAIADCNGLPIAISIKNATPHEIKLVEGTLDSIFINKTPKFLIGDKAYDSDALDQKLAKKNITLIAPNKCNRIKCTQDGRSLRRYSRRWKVERLFAWLQNFRRIVTRYERKACNYLGFVLLGCMKILLRQF